MFTSSKASSCCTTSSPRTASPPRTSSTGTLACAQYAGSNVGARFLGLSLEGSASPSVPSRGTSIHIVRVFPPQLFEQFRRRPSPQMVMQYAPLVRRRLRILPERRLDVRAIHNSFHLERRAPSRRRQPRHNKFSAAIRRSRMRRVINLVSAKIPILNAQRVVVRIRFPFQVREHFARIFPHHAIPRELRRKLCVILPAIRIHTFHFEKRFLRAPRPAFRTCNRILVAHRRPP